MATQWYQGKVLQIRQLTTSVRQFFIEVHPNETIFDFLPGQFITLDLPVSDKRLNRWRSYSIANHPDGTNILELCIVQSDEGLGTKYLFHEVVEGTELKFKGPDGGFVLPGNLQTELVFICTGTGIAPFRSMINKVIKNDMSFKKIHLVFGCRTASDILYKDEFQKIVEEKINFKYDVALSRDDHPDFHHGYIHDIYLKQYAEVSPDRQFYLCGWSSMIDEAVVNLIIKMGYDKSQIHYELYG